MRSIRVLALALALPLLLVAGRGLAEAVQTGHWLIVKVAVDPTTKAITLTRRHTTYTVTARGLGMADTLAQQDGSYVYAHLAADPAGGWDCDGLAGHNPQPQAIKVQGATDDDSPLAWIQPDDYFIVTGQVTAEEEAGGDLYLCVGVNGGGRGGDANTGFVLASQAEVWSYKP